MGPACTGSPRSRPARSRSATPPRCRPWRAQARTSPPWTASSTAVRADTATRTGWRPWPAHTSASSRGASCSRRSPTGCTRGSPTPRAARTSPMGRSTHTSPVRVSAGTSPSWSSPSAGRATSPLGWCRCMRRACLPWTSTPWPRSRSTGAGRSSTPPGSRPAHRSCGSRPAGTRRTRRSSRCSRADRAVSDGRPGGREPRTPPRGSVRRHPPRLTSTATRMVEVVGWSSSV